MFIGILIFPSHYFHFTYFFLQFHIQQMGKVVLQISISKTALLADGLAGLAEPRLPVARTSLIFIQPPAPFMVSTPCTAVMGASTLSAASR